MKILWIRPFFLHPTIGGAEVLSLHILRRLHRNHEIHFVAHLLAATRDVALKGSTEFCTHVWPVNPPSYVGQWRPYVAQLLREWLSGMPVNVACATSSEMQAKVRELVAREHFDAIVCDGLFVVLNVPNLSDCILLNINVETVIPRRHVETQADTLIRLHYRIEARHMEKIEKRACREALHVIALSKVDADLLQSRFGAKEVSVIPFGADIETLTPPRQDKDWPKFDLLFVGAMDTGPNVDAVLWFAREVLPLIRRERPDCSVAIVGRSPEKSVVDLMRQHQNVHVSGTVPDVKPWLWGSKVSIVPIRSGSGIRTKIYEAMAAKIPVVSTTLGAEGLHVHPGTDILLGDTPGEFARHCLDLLARPERRLEIAEAAWNMVRENFSWEKTAADVERILQQFSRLR